MIPTVAATIARFDRLTCMRHNDVPPIVESLKR
jgi:hypothetical protein